MVSFIHPIFKHYPSPIHFTPCVFHDFGSKNPPNSTNLTPKRSTSETFGTSCIVARILRGHSRHGGAAWVLDGGLFLHGLLGSDKIFLYPRHPNTSWEGVWDMFLGSKYLLRRCLDVQGYVYIYIHIINTLPETNSLRPWKKGHPKRKGSSSNHPFSGAMLVSGGYIV